MASEHWDLDQDNTLGGNSPSPNKVSSQKAIKEYIDGSTGSTVDQHYNGSSINAQSGTAVSEAINTVKRNIGEIITSILPLTDAALHLLDGTLLSGDGSYGAFVDYIGDLYDSSNYPNLFTIETLWQNSIATYGECGKFVYTAASGNDPATVRLPKIEGIIQGSSSILRLGDLIEAGLPVHTHTASTNTTGAHTHGRGTMEIVGTFAPYVGGENNGIAWDSKSYKCTGAFYRTSISNGKTSTNTSNNWARAGLGFKASDGWTGATESKGDHSHTVTVNNISDDIHGNSTTVQPQTIKVLFYIVVANSTKTEIEVDIDEIVTDLNGKADTDLTNINPSCTPIDGQWVMPYSMTNIANGVTYPTSTDDEYDISSFLPNDGYDYEVLILGSVTTGATSGNPCNLNLQTDILTNSNYVIVCGTRTRATANTYATGTTILPVGVGRKIVVVHQANLVGTYSIWLNGYRRIGTNS